MASHDERRFGTDQASWPLDQLPNYGGARPGMRGFAVFA